MKSEYRLQLDPFLTLHRGELYNDLPDKNFRSFLESSPDRWGRILMQRRAAIEHHKGLRSSARLTELDYLLGCMILFAWEEFVLKQQNLIIS